MKLDKKTLILLVVLAGIAVLVAAWMILAKPLKTKTATLEAENAELKVKAEEYEAVNAQRTVYEEGIETLKAERADLLAAFPAGMTREDEIMYWANMERANASTLRVNNIVMSGWEEVYVEGQPEVTEEGASQLHLYKGPVNYTYVSTYDGLKDMVNYVFEQADKKSIRNLTAAYDSSTGNLSGSIDIDMYYMVGTGNEYVPVSIPSVPTGVTDIFHSTNTLTDTADISEFNGSEETENSDEEAED